jgi:hypothetical protein
MKGKVAAKLELKAAESLAWCQWWNSGPLTSHRSGPNLNRTLAWVKAPRTNWVANTMAMTLVPKPAT